MHTGLYSSRSSVKGFVREASALLASLRTADATLTMHGDCGMHGAVRSRCPAQASCADAVWLSY